MFKKIYVYLIGVLLVIIIFILSILFIYKNMELDKKEKIEELSLVTESDIKNEVKTTEAGKKIYVDVKGAVKKPGVYEMHENAIVNDAIKKAGGLKKSATTKNINLSKKLKDEMVIYVFTKNQVSKDENSTEIVNEVPFTTEVIDVSSCTTTTQKKESTNTTDQQKTLVNINTASKEELMTVSGIGPSKADSIIAYRQENEFKTIEDIKNVTGIGEALYAKIKDFITV